MFFASEGAILPGSANRTITRDMDLVADLNADLSIVSIVFALDEEYGVGTDEMGTVVQESRTVGDRSRRSNACNRRRRKIVRYCISR